MSIYQDLNKVDNKECAKCKKKNLDRYLIEGICSNCNSVNDQLPVRCVKEWGVQKIHFLRRYFEMFSVGMHQKWEGKINYIEICSGPGRLINRDNGFEFDGTPLALINNKGFKYLNKAVFVDINSQVIASLNKRFKIHDVEDKAIAIEGDYLLPDKLIRDIKKITGQKGLFLIFFDPTDCSIPNYTIRKISEAFNKCDIINLVAYGMDARRNLRLAFENEDSKARRKYERFLGTESFFNSEENQKLLDQASYGLGKLHKVYLNTFQDSLRSFGYSYFGVQQIEHLYDLSFASKDKKGLDFWNKAKSKGLAKQLKLFN
jgi:three-Cys-motif partner protein